MVNISGQQPIQDEKCQPNAIHPTGVFFYYYYLGDSNPVSTIKTLVRVT